MPTAVKKNTKATKKKTEKSATGSEIKRVKPKIISYWDGKSLFMVHDQSEVVDFSFPDVKYGLMFGPYRDQILNYMGNIVGASIRRSKMVSLKDLSTHWKDIQKHLKAYYDISNTANVLDQPEFKRLDSIIEEFRAEQRERIKRARDTGRIEFMDIEFLFSKDDKLVVNLDGERLAGKFKEISLRHGFVGPYWQIKFSVIHNFSSQGLSEGVTSTYIGGYSGFKDIAALGVNSLTESEEKVLIERGRFYRDVASKATYVQYDGQLARYSWWSDKNYRSTGRAMIDSASFKRVDSDQWGSQQRHFGVDDDDDHNYKGDGSSTAAVQYVIKDEDLYRTHPFLCGFSFSSKQWGAMAVSHMTPINWQDNAFDLLVLDPERKELVRALVEHHVGTFGDVIAGKGGGVIFMLAGPPGQGKTLTAETIAEILHRPLYSISVGELGINPDELEDRLRVILDVAMEWNAVLLLDEADIFLRQRNESDIVRNAMVGVFLRLLEYHQGVMFLTTNLNDSIDHAFLSRISVILHFEEAEAQKRTRIWSNLLHAAEVSADIKSLSESLGRDHNLNGRQIKNVIRLSQTLSKARQVPITLDLITKVISLCHVKEKKIEVRQAA